MISCPSTWLIKLCVVFMLNMSLFTTGTAPPLRGTQAAIQSQIQKTTTTALTTTLPTTSSSSTTSSSVDFPNGDTKSTTRTNKRNIFPASLSSSSNVNVTVGSSSEIKGTFSTSTKATSWRKVEQPQGSSSSSSLSTKFHELLSTISASPPSYSTAISDSDNFGAKLAISDDHYNVKEKTPPPPRLIATSLPTSVPVGRQHSSIITSTSNLEHDGTPVISVSESLSELVVYSSSDPEPTSTSTLTIDQDYQGEEEFKEVAVVDNNIYPEDSLERGVIFSQDFTPEDIAEYIFLTGDESGVASTFNDLIDEGLMLMSRTETIKFLEAVQTHLNYLEEQYKAFLLSEKTTDTTTTTSATSSSSSSPGSRMWLS